MQCSKGGTDPVATTPDSTCVSPSILQANGTCKNPDGKISCPLGQTLQADGTCKSPDGTITCKVGEMENANKECVAITCTSVQTLNASGICVTKACPTGQTLNTSNGMCEVNCPIGQSWNAASLTCADLTLTWTILESTSNMKIARSGMGTATIGNKIYVFGGASDITLNNTEVFDTTTKIWTTLEPTSNMKIGRSNMGFSTIGNKIYVFGGRRDSVTLDSTEFFDTTTKIWTTLGPTSNMKIARSSMGFSTVIGGTQIYAFGGKTINAITLNTTEVFDTTTNIWTTLGPTSNMKIARSRMGTATIGTNIYAFGGEDALGQSRTITEVFDTITKIWTSLEPTSNMNVARTSMGTVNKGNKIYAFGGSSLTGNTPLTYVLNIFGTTEIFDTTTNVWSILGDTSNLKLYKYNMGTAIIDNKIYAFGGANYTENNIETEFFVIVP